MSQVSTTTDQPRQPRLGPIGRSGVWISGRPLAVMAMWVILIAGAVWQSAYLTTHLSGNTSDVIGSDSEAANTLVAEAFPNRPDETAFVVLHSADRVASDPAFEARVKAAVSAVSGGPRVESVVSPYTNPQALISADKHTALVPVALTGTAIERQGVVDDLVPLAESADGQGVDATLTGVSPLAQASILQSEEDLGRAELIGIPAAAIVLLLAFGSVTAAALPLLLGGIAVVTSFGALGVLAHVVSFDVVVRTAVSMLVIALGIDYSLFIINRYRSELAAGDAHDPDHRRRAIGVTMQTAGSAVLFSGMTLAVSLAGLLLVRSAKTQTMAIGMITAVLVMLLLVVTLLPAVLGLLGRRINALALPWARSSIQDPHPEHSIWARIVRHVLHHPIAYSVGSAVLLVTLALPVGHLKYGVDTGASAVAQTSAGRGYATITENFAAGTLDPITVVATSETPFTDAQLDAIAELTDRAAARDGVVSATSVTSVLDAQVGAHSRAALERVPAPARRALDGLLSSDGTVATITVVPQGAAVEDRTADLVRDLRADAAAAGDAAGDAGVSVHVGGSAASYVDMEAESARALPIVIAAVLLAAMVLLFFAFRSVLLPIKAIAMNLLTTGASFGLAVLIFQDGFGAELLGVDRTGFIQVFLPLLAFAVVFGCSMDYEVFMLSRMREQWDHLRDNNRAVTLGVTQTASVITAAAAIMVVVFGAFLFTRILEIKQLGFMLAVAVLIDATVVRMVLVPALMKLMGRWNWWLPGRPAGQRESGAARSTEPGAAEAAASPELAGRDSDATSVGASLD